VKHLHPLVSIGLPTRNGARSIRHILDSLLSQTYPHLELIISDNASTDDTEKICQEYAKKDPRIKYLRQKENVGISDNFRFVLDQATGKYFMWAADDDKWEFNYVEVLKSVLERNPTHGVTMSSIVRIYDNDVFFDKILLTGRNDLTHLGYIAVFNKLLQGVKIHLFIYGLFRTTLIKKLMSRPFPTCIAGDRILISELALMTHFYSVKDILFTKTIAKKSIAVRYSDEKLGKEWRSPAKNLRFVITMINRLFTSPFIPLQRKLYTVPSLIFFIFIHIPHIIRDLIPFKRNIISFYRKLTVF